MKCNEEQVRSFARALAESDMLPGTGIALADLAADWLEMQAERDSLRKRLADAEALIAVQGERLELFEDIEPFGRACAEWVLETASCGAIKQDARRYLSPLARAKEGK